jgi:beta-lactamase regulating signal transducer with metallopeptidase domain
MAALDRFYPGDQVVGGLVLVAAAVVVVSTVAVLAVRAFRSRAALRHSLLLSALLCCLLSPLSAAAVLKFKIALIELPLFSPTATKAGVATAASEPVAESPRARAESLASTGAHDLRPPAEDRANERSNELPAAVLAVTRASPNRSNTNEAQSEPQDAGLRRLASAATFVWAVGTILVLVGIVRCCLRLRRLRASLGPARDDFVSDALADVGRRMKIRRLPPVGISAEAFTPVAVGWLRPVIVLPESSLRQITREQLRDVLVHEMAHILRGDHFVVALQLASKAIFWPIVTVHLLNRQLVCAREEVCDNFVLDERDPVSYGETLLRLAQLAHGWPPLAASTGILHWRGSLETRIEGLFSSRRNRQKTGGLLAAGALFTLFGATSAVICSTSLVASQDKAPAAPHPTSRPVLPAPELSQSHLPFDGNIFERVLTGAQTEPVFIDIDTGRWMTPPPDLLAVENQGKPVDQWVFPVPLKRWVQSNGIDLAAQTDGRGITLVGFDLRVGKVVPPDQRLEASFVAKLVATADFQRPEWISLRGRLSKSSFGQKNPFITREGGLGTFWITLYSFEFRGRNSMCFDYELVRDPDVPKLTGQQIGAVFEPSILRQFDQPLVADVQDDRLRLRLPGAAERIELGAGELVVRSARGVELRAARLNTGTLDIDAHAGRALIFGRGKEATLRRKGNRVQIEMQKQLAEADRVAFWMPELNVVNQLAFEWIPTNAPVDGLRQRGEKLRKIREEKDAILAELANKPGYSLAPGQVLRHIAPPYPSLRAEYWRVALPNEFGVPAGGDEPKLVASYRWDGKLHCEDFSPGSDRWPLIGVCDSVHRIKSQQISGPPELLQTSLPGDWVYREGVPDELFARQFEAILRQELQLPIHLEFRQVKREVYVARGDYHFTPLPDDKTGKSRGVQIYGRVLSPNGGGGYGTFGEFLNWAGRWIDMPIVSEVKAHPQQLLWRLHEPAGKVARPATDAEKREAHDPALVLHNVEQQTGLHFTKETRPVKMLFVERKPL